MGATKKANPGSDHSQSAEYSIAFSTASTRAPNLPSSVEHETRALNLLSRVQHDLEIQDSQRKRRKSLHHHRQSIFDFIAHL